MLVHLVEALKGYPDRKTVHWASIPNYTYPTVILYKGDYYRFENGGLVHKDLVQDYPGETKVDRDYRPAENGEYFGFSEFVKTNVLVLE